MAGVDLFGDGLKGNSLCDPCMNLGQSIRKRSVDQWAMYSGHEGVSAPTVSVKRSPLPKTLLAVLILVSLSPVAYPQEAVTNTGCSVRGFARETRTEASQFGRGLKAVPRSVVRPSNLKWELPILAATGVMIAKVDRPAANRIQSKSLQQTAGRWSNVGLGLELGSAALAYGIGCGKHHSYLRDTGFKALAAMGAAGGADLALKLAFDRQFPYTPNKHGKVLGRRKVFSIWAFSHKFRICGGGRSPLSPK